MIFYLTGIPTVEKHLLEEFGDKYADYQRRVPMIIPLPKFGAAIKDKMEGINMGNLNKGHQQPFSGGQQTHQNIPQETMKSK